MPAKKKPSTKKRKPAASAKKKPKVTTKSAAKKPAKAKSKKKSEKKASATAIAAATEEAVAPPVATDAPRVVRTLDGAHPDAEDLPRLGDATHTLAGAVRLLKEIGVLLQLDGANPFKVRAFENGARTIEALHGDIGTLIESGELEKTAGVGPALLESLTEYAADGTMWRHTELRAKFPPTLFDVLDVPGLGPKKVKTLYEELNIASLDNLEQAIADDRLSGLKGFGAKTTDNLARNIEFLKLAASRYLIHEAEHGAAQIAALLEALPGVIEFSLAGSMLRHKETVHDIDFVCAAEPDDTPAVMNAFTGIESAWKVIAHGATKSSIALDNGLQVDLRVVTPVQYPFALMHFTGSKEHNIAMRGRAIAQGLKLSEYGLFDADGNSPALPDEAAIYGALGLPFIPPELREDYGELAAAEAGALPTLFEEADLRGVFHVHTVRSDGSQTLEQVADDAIARGYEYVGISDHSQTAMYARGLRPDAVREQWADIDALSAKLDGKLRLFKGIESDILTDGSLDYPDDILAGFDFVVASVHSGFKRDEAAMTARIVRAVENPYTTILGHPTGRLLLMREGYPLDIEAVLQACAMHGVTVEINADPHRLDLDWRHVKRAKELGVKIAINPDAHHVRGFDNTRFGVGIARKGWLEARDVLNTRPVDTVLAK